METLHLKWWKLMKINQLFYLLALLMATISLGSVRAEEEKSVSSVSNRTNVMDSCHAGYDTEGQLSIPCVNVSGLSYAVKLRPISIDNTQFILLSVTPNSVAVNSACISNYSDLTGELDIPCLKILEISNKLILWADNPKAPSIFGKLTGGRRTDSRGQFASTAMSTTGMYYPTNTKNRGGYLGWWETNSDFGDACHLGVDIKANEGDSVYAIWSGTVRYASMDSGSYGNNGTQGGAIIIEHHSRDGSIFYALYGHLKNLAIKDGDKVRAHQFIANIGPWYNSPHLHFGINLDNNASDNTLLKGYTTDSNCSDNRGFVEPFNFIETTSVDEKPENFIAYFDGAGSLISPAQRTTLNGYGAYRDTARMQSHSEDGRLSTVVFQFKKDDSCDHINITSKDIEKAIIQVKYWNEDKATKAFISKLPISVPNHGNYTVVTVTSAQPLSSAADVDADCKKSRDAMEGSLSDLDMDIWGDVILDNDYFWTGTGSIISLLDTDSSKKDYGKDVDEVPIPDFHKSLSSFQWYPSDSCKKLRISPISTTVSGVSFSGDEGIDSKLWLEPSWTKRTECKGLPCTITSSKEEYYVVKVKIDEQHARELDKLEAKCSN